MAALQFNWESCYELGIAIIDEQHKTLVGIYNKLAKAFIAQKTSDILQDILKELNDYADFHFKTEEQLFIQKKLRGLEEHLQEHHNYLVKMKQFEDTIKLGINIDFSLLSFIKKWWSDHILISDREYAQLITKS